MLKCASLLVSRSAHAHAFHRQSTRQTSALALPTFIDALATSSLSTNSIVSSSISRLWTKCITLVNPGINIPTILKKPIENSVLLVQKGEPSPYSPGFIRSGSNKFGDLRENIYRNVFPQFASEQKKWIWRLVAANAATLVLWQTYGNMPNGRQTMWENFMVSIKSVRSGRLWLFLTSAISSNDLITFSLNTTALISFGMPILAAIGSVPFFATYFGTAFIGAFAHLSYYAFPVQAQTPTPNQLWYSDHASYHSSTAAAAGLSGFYAGAWWRQPTLVANTFRVPPAVLVLAFSLLQIYHADNTRQPWSGNLGALATGLALGFLFRGRIKI